MRPVFWALISAIASCATTMAQTDSGPTSQPAAAAAAPQMTEAIINAPPAELWEVFSTAAGFKKLGVAQCDMDFRIGGLIRTHYDPQGVLGDEGTIENEILAYEPQRMLAFRIHKPPAGFPFPDAWKSTWNVITLSDLGDGRTNVRLAGLGYDESEESQGMRHFFEKGNAWVMQHLQRQFDREAPPPADQAHADQPLAAIHHERVVGLPRADVWRLLTTSDGWRRLFLAQAHIELRPDGPFEILFDASAPQGQQGSEGCTVMSFVPEEMLSFTWSAPPKFATARQRRTWVVVRLDELSPNRTRVSLDHQGFAEQAAENAASRSEWEDVRAYFLQAWGKVLDALQNQSRRTSM
jgi:uncharacterized protein YndB with AHSA1/START domain